MCTAATYCLLECGQILERIDWLAIQANFEMEQVAIDTTGAEFGDFLAPSDSVLFGYHKGPVVGVGRQKSVAVLDDDEVAVAQQTAAGVNHLAIGSNQHGIAGSATDVDALVFARVVAEASNDVALMRPVPD